MATGLDMTITAWVANSCACVAIQDLGKRKDPLDAMHKFCELELVVKGWGAKAKPTLQKVFSFYVFISGPEKGGEIHSKAWVKYGTEFAAYIKDNNLGTVATLDRKPNFKHHGTTDCQVWLWSPDQTALETWWKEVGSKVPPPPAPPKPVPVARDGWNGNGRPIAIKGADICPNCGRTYNEHCGWNCPDGGIWPEK